jgi:hypothetical protein
MQIVGLKQQLEKQRYGNDTKYMHHPHLLYAPRGVVTTARVAHSPPSFLLLSTSLSRLIDL